MLQGMTAHYLTRSTFPLKAGDTCLVHAAAGGAGALIVQMAQQLGARVFGTVSTREGGNRPGRGRRRGDLLHGAGFRREARRLTGGRGVDVVYDGVGKTTFDKSLDCLRLARHDGAVRRVQRRGAAVRPVAAESEGVAVPDASEPRRTTSLHARN